MASPPDPSPFPKQLGEFELVRELGRGGMGVVFEAVQTSLNRRVALKVLGSGLGLTPRAVDRFRREAAAAAKLHHTNIVPVYSTGEERGTHFYAMELIDGPGLDAVIRQLRNQTPATSTPAISSDLATTNAYVPADPLTASSNAGSVTGSSTDRFDRIAAMIANVADALHHAHQNGVTHRDIKPSNLLLATDGRLSVTDFGLAKMLEQPGMTVTGEFVGTPAYMSPEQITAGRIPVDHRTDIYSLGATLYELLTLRPPFVADGRDRLLAMVVQKEPTPPRRVSAKIPKDLETISLKCLEKDPDRRYASAKDLADDLRRFINRFAVVAKRTGPLDRFRKWVKRNPAIAAASVLLTLSCAAGAFFAWQAGVEKQQRRLDKEKQDADALVDRRKHAMERAIVAAMGSQFAEADKALAEADALGADYAERHFTAGILLHFRGESKRSIAELELACQARPNWVAGWAFYASAASFGGDWNRYVLAGNRTLELQPETPEDYLFRGYMVSFPNPKRGLADVEEGLRQRRSTIGLIARTEALSNVSDESLTVADGRATLAAAQVAREMLPDSPMSLMLYVCARNNLALAYRRVGDSQRAREELAVAEPEAAILRSVRNQPNALLVSFFHAWLGGKHESFEADLADAGKKFPGGFAGSWYLAMLFRQGRIDEGLNYLDALPPDLDDLLAVRLLFRAEKTGVLSESDLERLQRYTAGIRESSARDVAIGDLYVLGRIDAAERIAGEWVRRDPKPSPLDQLDPWHRRLNDHQRGAISDSQILVEMPATRWRECTGHCQIGLRALSRGERAVALTHLRKAVENPPFVYYSHWLSAYADRLEKDPTWPKWIPVK